MTSTEIKIDIWNMPKSKNVVKNGEHGFLLLFIIIYWSQKSQRKKLFLRLAVKIQCWSENLANFMQI